MRLVQPPVSLMVLFALACGARVEGDADAGPSDAGSPIVDAGDLHDDAGPPPEPQCEGPLVAPFGFEHPHKCAYDQRALDDAFDRFWWNVYASDLRACASDAECTRANINVTCTDGATTSSTWIGCGIAVNVNTACELFELAQREWEEACANRCMPHDYLSTPQCIPSEPRCLDARCELAWGDDR